MAYSTRSARPTNAVTFAHCPFKGERMEYVASSMEWRHVQWIEYLRLKSLSSLAAYQRIFLKIVDEHDLKFLNPTAKPPEAIEQCEACDWNIARGTNACSIRWICMHCGSRKTERRQYSRHNIQNSVIMPRSRR